MTRHFLRSLWALLAVVALVVAACGDDGGDGGGAGTTVAGSGAGTTVVAAGEAPAASRARPTATSTSDNWTEYIDPELLDRLRGRGRGGGQRDVLRLQRNDACSDPDGRRLRPHRALGLHDFDHDHRRLAAAAPARRNPQHRQPGRVCSGRLRLPVAAIRPELAYSVAYQRQSPGSASTPRWSGPISPPTGWCSTLP